MTVRIGEENEAEQIAGHLGGLHRLRQRRTPSSAAWAWSGRPGWTTRERSPRSAPSPGTSARSSGADRCTASRCTMLDGAHGTDVELTRTTRNTSVARDYYGLLGVSQRPTTRRSSAPTASWPASCTPTSTRTRPRRRGSRRSPRAYEVLSDPEKRRIVDLGGDPLETAGGRRRAGGFGRRPFGGSATSSTPSSAAAGGGAPRPARPGPARRRLADPDRPRPRGVRDRRHQASSPSTPRCCATAARAAAPTAGSHAGHLRHLRRPRRGADRAALVPRPGRDLAAVPGLPRRRRGHPRPVPPVRRRRPGRARGARSACKIPAGVGDGMRVRLAGQGEVGPGGGPAGRPVRRGPRAAARRTSPRRRRPALHRARADDGAALGTTVRLRDARRATRSCTSRRAPSPAPCTPCAARACRGCARAPAAAATCMVHLDVVVPDPARRPRRPSCCASSPTLRGEEQPELSGARATALFGRALAASRGRVTERPD